LRFAGKAGKAARRARAMMTMGLRVAALVRALLLVVAAPQRREASGGVAVIATTDCRTANPNTFREFGTQLTASMVQLIRMRDLFPEWDAFLVTRREKWGAGVGKDGTLGATCEEAWEDLSALYSER